ncbi:MAG TPA: hypothetical protein VJC05_02645 [Candidatus Andersenbacteria bacterium]|nr:hypothetical protein [Candidatus Andersenbacteria bacterium]
MPFGHQPATYAALAAYCRRVAEAVYREVEEQCAELLEKYRGQRQAEEAVAALRQRAAGTRQRLHERARQMERRG